LRITCGVIAAKHRYEAWTIHRGKPACALLRLVPDKTDRAGIHGFAGAFQFDRDDLLSVLVGYDDRRLAG
jgi:hypothetical protein